VGGAPGVVLPRGARLATPKGAATVGSRIRLRCEPTNLNSEE